MVCPNLCNHHLSHRFFLCKTKICKLYRFLIGLNQQIVRFCIIPLACKHSMARVMLRPKLNATWLSIHFGQILVKYFWSDIQSNIFVTITIKGSLQAPINLTRFSCFTLDIILTSWTKRPPSVALSSEVLPRWRTLMATIWSPYLPS